MTNPIKAVLFDFDGTLTRPGALDFPAFKKAAGFPADVPVLEYLEKISDADRRQKALAMLDAFEISAAEKSEPNPGAEEIVRFLRDKGLYVGIISRNGLNPIRRAFRNFSGMRMEDFHLIISRDDPVKPKPCSDGIHLAAQRLRVRVQEILVVGDFVFDVEAGRKAGAPTVYLNNRNVPLPEGLSSDYTISTLDGLREIVRMLTPLPAGKLPNDLLKKFLERFVIRDPSVLVNPGVGEDTAAVIVEGEELLILKSDPITFATDSIGQYAVLVNANDIATSGASPRWLLSTLLFPRGTTADTVGRVMADLSDTCRKWGISLCGGHTEITDAVTKPVVIGMLAGTVKKSGLIDKKNMRAGDIVLFSKAVAVEGTAIIARELGDRLRDQGMPEAEIAECRRFLKNISILREARIASGLTGISAMHDVTEGGLATAAEELSVAGKHRMRIHMDRIPVFPQTEKICGFLGLNPLGLIGSGSLLICCRRETAEPLIRRAADEGIALTPIGEVLEVGEGILAVSGSRTVSWPKFEVDEISRLF